MMMKGKLVFVLTVLVFLFSQLETVEGQDRDDYVDQAKRILEEVPLIDGHNDVPWQYRRRVDNHLDSIDLAQSTKELDPPMHTDLARLREGRVGGQFWSVYIPSSIVGEEAVQTTMEQVDFVYRMTDRYSDDLEMAYTADDVRRIHENGKIASLIGMEGGHSINNSLAVLRMFYEMGARYMTLTHADNPDWADAATDDPEFNGLSEFGEEVVREMNRLGMLVDLSHVSAETMHDALDVTRAPVIFSHSSAYGLVDHPRNVPDDVLERTAENNGLVMITFVTSFVSNEMRQYNADRSARAGELNALYPDDPDRRSELMDEWEEENPLPLPDIYDVADHIDYVKDKIGVEYVGIGGDYDGITLLPEGLEDVSTYPDLFAELLSRGYTEEELKKIAGLNALRVMEDVEEVARELENEEASDMRLEDE